jgi:hypothetical protein
MAAPTRVDGIHDHGIQLKPAAQQDPPQHVAKWRDSTWARTPLAANQSAITAWHCTSGLMRHQ